MRAHTHTHTRAYGFFLLLLFLQKRVWIGEQKKSRTFMIIIIITPHRRRDLNDGINAIGQTKLLQKKHRIGYTGS